MTPIFVAAAALALAAAFVRGSEPQSAGVRGFSYGVAAGEITPSSAVVWTRAGRSGPVTLELSRDVRFRRHVVRTRLRARAENDNTVQTRARGLRPATNYVYRFRQGAVRSALGRFRTAPRPTAGAVVEFAVTGDADGTRVRETGRPLYNRFEVYAAMAAERNDFNVNLGDTIYSDSSVVPGAPPALTAPQKWAKYRENLSLPALRRLRAATGLYSHWDDHEFINDFTRAEHGEAIYRAGVKAFTDYSPVSYSPARGLYRTFRWGRHLELFFLDERSFRDAKASADGACNSGRTPDLAPTAPQAVRAAFAALAPSLATPPPAVCVDRIRDPRRTMLGQRQYELFTDAVRRSTATFKVIVNEVPIQQFYANPYDRWEGYEAERLRLVEFLRDNVRNVVFLTSDVHATLVNDVRLRTLEPGGPVDTGILEVTTGPVATNTFSRLIDGVLGRSGGGDAVTYLFFKPQPPRGIGMLCAATDVYSYAQVRVTSSTLTITPKGADGKRIREKTGGSCGPYTVRRR